jgi:hypothetical protein
MRDKTEGDRGGSGGKKMKVTGAHTHTHTHTHTGDMDRTTT